MNNGKNIKNDYIWNTLGSIMLAITSPLLSIIVINKVGGELGGIFSFGYSTMSTFIFIISYFGVRAFQIVDVKYNYSFSDYFFQRIFTTFFGLFFSLMYIFILYLIGNYTLYKSIIILLLSAQGLIEGFMDVYECEFQRKHKLYLSGQSVFFRLVLFFVSFVLILYLTDNLFMACILSIFFKFISIYFLTLKSAKKIITEKYTFEKLKIKQLFISTLPLFLSMFFDLYIYSSSKFAIDINLTDSHSGFYNLLFMPANIVYLMMSVIIKPLLTTFSEAYFSNIKEYSKLRNKFILFAVFIAIIFIVGVLIFGNLYIYIINTITFSVYEEFLQYGKYILIFTFLGVGIYAIYTPIYYCLLIEKRQKDIFICYILGMIFAKFSSDFFVIKYGLIGASVSFLLNIFALCILFYIFYFFRYNLNHK